MNVRVQQGRRGKGLCEDSPHRNAGVGTWGPSDTAGGRQSRGTATSENCLEVSNNYTHTYPLTSNSTPRCTYTQEK